VNTCFYEVLRKPNTTLSPIFDKKTKNGDKIPITDYIERLEANFDSIKKPMIMRKKYWIDQNARDEWLMDLIADDDVMKATVLNQKSYEQSTISGQYAWPRNQHGCDAYGGCTFQDVCKGACRIEQLPNITKER